MYNAVVCLVFEKVVQSPLLIPERFHPLRKKPNTRQQLLPIPPPQAPVNHKSAFFLDLFIRDISYKLHHTV